MVNQEEILVKIVNKIVGEEDLVKESNLLQTIKKNNGDLTRVYEEQTNSQRKRVTVTQSHNKAGGKELKIQKETLAQGPRFKMHYLGIMFGGMALNRAMSNLTATSKEWVGIGELMSTTMGVVMLPATLALLDVAVLPLMDALLGMPEWVQTTVGITVLGLEGLGAIAMTAGQLMLGAAAFSYQFPEMAAAIKSGLTSNIAKWAGKGVLVAVGLTIAWQSIDFIRDGIEEGSLVKEIMGVIGMGTGLGMVGLALGGPAGGLLGFTLGVGIGLLIDWFIKENNFVDRAKALGVSDEDIARELFKDTLFGQLSQIGRDEGSNVLIDLARNPELLVDGGFQGFAVGGNVSNTGLHMLHEGETVLRKDQSEQGGNVSIVYNVTVSDKREFEQMLKNNSQAIIREVRKS